MKTFAGTRTATAVRTPRTSNASRAAVPAAPRGEAAGLGRILGNQAYQRLLAGGVMQAKRRDPARPGTGVPAPARAAESHGGVVERLTANAEALSGVDLSGVRVHANSSQPARYDALAYAQGHHIHLGPGQDRHLAHELWHVVQQRQGRVPPGGLDIGGTAVNDDTTLESEADRMAVRLSGPVHAGQAAGTLSPPAAGDASRQPLQRQVRINGGRTRVNEADYQRGGAKASVGSRYSVAALIADRERRVFTSVTELEDYANGRTDYIGLVTTTSAGYFWYRLPANRLTVLGERHENPSGNVEDVIMGLRTSRFMYEPFNEFTDVAPFTQANIGTGTQTRLAQVHGGLRVAGRVDRTNFNPDLENIVIKALAGAVLTRNEYIAASPRRMSAAQQQIWGARASTSDYSIGERTALYLSYAIHLAQDIAQYSFGRRSRRESAYVRSARRLRGFYNSHQAVLDQFAQAKDRDDLIGIYELTSPRRFRNLSVIRDFTVAFHEFASRYIEQLGVQSGSATLQAEGRSLARHRRAGLDDLNPAREEIMWQRIQHAQANGYLIVGMGDAHRANLQTRLTGAGIRNEEVESALLQQRSDINAQWVP